MMWAMDFNRIAHVYDSGRAMPLESLSGWRDAVAPLLGGGGRAPLLDLGAGTGMWAEAFARWFGVPVIAVEPAEGMRREALLARAHPGVKLVGGDAERIPLRDGACRAAWLSAVIHHVPDPARCARELRRVVAPGGPVLLRGVFGTRIDPAKLTIYRFFPQAMAVAERFPKLPAIEAAFAAAGWTVESVTDVPQVSAPSLRAALDRARHRADTTLQGISDADFAAGLVALERAAAAETEPTPVVDRLDLVVLR
jgi:ubiquinone/menaquinone biosynthesis C-methylase UbiE